MIMVYSLVNATSGMPPDFTYSACKRHRSHSAFFTHRSSVIWSVRQLPILRPLGAMPIISDNFWPLITFTITRPFFFNVRSFPYTL